MSACIICPCCGYEIDPEVCWCGNLMNDHHEDHSPVPMGCECGRAKQHEIEHAMKNEDKENNPEKEQPIKTEPGTGGQNPYWPGDKTLKPDDSDPDTKIPLVR